MTLQTVFWSVKTDAIYFGMPYLWSFSFLRQSWGAAPYMQKHFVVQKLQLMVGAQFLQWNSIFSNAIPRWTSHACPWFRVELCQWNSVHSNAMPRLVLPVYRRIRGYLQAMEQCLEKLHSRMDLTCVKMEESSSIFFFCQKFVYLLNNWMLNVSLCRVFVCLCVWEKIWKKNLKR